MVHLKFSRRHFSMINSSPQQYRSFSNGRELTGKLERPSTKLELKPTSCYEFWSPKQHQFVILVGFSNDFRCSFTLCLFCMLPIHQKIIRKTFSLTVKSYCCNVSQLENDKCKWFSKSIASVDKWMLNSLENVLFEKILIFSTCNMDIISCQWRLLLSELI